MRGGVANEFKRRAVEMIRAGPRHAEDAKRRIFYGPGINNFDLALHKVTNITESKTLELRFETFNTFNHAQFYPNGSIGGNINSPTFWHVLKASVTAHWTSGIEV
jgi:hypothetical protein